jgi:hypothetical protein
LGRDGIGGHDPTERAMRPFKTMRFSVATVMMLVVTAAACSALFAKAREHVPAVNQPSEKFDTPFNFVLGIVLTAVALGSFRGHTAVQMMLQATVACLGFLSLIWLAEAGMRRPLAYWLEAGVGLLVTIPLVARRAVGSGMAPGPRRDWWRGTCESLPFSFVSMMLVLVGLFVQYGVVDTAGVFMARPASAKAKR